MLYKLSPSTRRAWIEIVHSLCSFSRKSVALHPEGVDRNCYSPVIPYEMRHVALHPEGVDRNYTAGVYGWNSDVALHPEGVDRNIAMYAL